MIRRNNSVYKLSVINRFGQVSILKSDDLERLKVVAKRLNANGCDVEITEEVVLFRIVDINK